MEGKSALIAGATGLIGSELLQFLLQTTQYERVYALVRNPLGMNHPKLTEVVVDFSLLNEYSQYFSVNDVFVCLGTTIKKAKTQEAMYKIDVEYPVEIGRIAKENGATHYSIVSAMNADPNSKIFYSRMKGELEQKVKALDFEQLSIFRPSLLLGNRQEFRLGEEIGAALSKGLRFLFVGPLKKYKAIEGKTVARAMYRVAQGKGKDQIIYSSAEIEEIGKK
ncbi:oxidoreductase [Ferdinandcohnia sp. Marseille-Q9671]